MKKKTDKMREASILSIKKVEELRELHKKIPRYIGTLNNFGGSLGYIADELDRIETETGIGVPISYELGFSPEEFITTFKFVENTPSSLNNMATTLSGMVSESTGTTMQVVAEQKIEKAEYLQDLPKFFREYNLDNELIPMLQKLKPALAENWQAVRDNLTLKTSEGIKNAVVHARTVVDEIGWMTDYSHLKSLPWGTLVDDKGDPIRAVRYAWIAYGNDLPKNLNNDPLKDHLYISLNSGYKEFGKITHISPTPLSQYPNAVTACNAVGTALIQYLEAGISRLKESNRESEVL